MNVVIFDGCIISVGPLLRSKRNTAFVKSSVLVYDAEKKYIAVDLVCINALAHKILNLGRPKTKITVRGAMRRYPATASDGLANHIFIQAKEITFKDPTEDGRAIQAYIEKRGGIKGSKVKGEEGTEEEVRLSKAALEAI